MRRPAFVAAAVAALAAGCGGHGPASSTTTSARPLCRTLAVAAVDSARDLLRAYRGQASPGDLAMYDLREALAFLQHNDCHPPVLGGALLERLSPRELRTLATVLPASYVQDLNQALGCSRGERPAAGCAEPAASIALPGAHPSGSSHPLVP